MGVPVVYRKSKEQFINSIDFTQIASATGVVQFKGFATESSGSIIARQIGENSVYSNPRGTAGTTTTSLNPTETLTDTYTFDNVAFNQPCRIRGKTIINCSHGSKSSGASSGGNAFIKFKLFKVSGSTETSMGEVTSRKVASANNTVLRTSCLEIDTTPTNFKIGDKIRLKLEFWVSDTDTNGCQVIIAHDPQNRDMTTSAPESSPFSLTASVNPSKFDIFIPFRLDL